MAATTNPFADPLPISDATVTLSSDNDDSDSDTDSDGSDDSDNTLAESETTERAGSPHTVPAPEDAGTGEAAHEGDGGSDNGSDGTEEGFDFTDNTTVMAKPPHDDNQYYACTSCWCEIDWPMVRVSSHEFFCKSAGCEGKLRRYRFCWIVDRTDVEEPPEGSPYKCDLCDAPRPYLAGADGTVAFGWCWTVARRAR